jgi:hypothetical protein
MEVETIRNKLVFKLIPELSKKIYENKTIEQIVATSKSFIKHYWELIMPEEYVELKPRILPPPQEVLEDFIQEEE